MNVRFSIQYLYNSLINYCAILCNRYWEKYLICMNVSNKDSSGVWISLSGSFPFLSVTFFFCTMRQIGTGEISDQNNDRNNDLNEWILLNILRGKKKPNKPEKNPNWQTVSPGYENTYWRELKENMGDAVSDYQETG